MIKLIIFDWDGTIADSVSKILACKVFLANKYHLPHPSEQMVRSVLGTKFEDAMAKCFPDAPSSVLQKMGEEFHLLMQQDEYQAQLFPNIKEQFNLLKQKGIKIAVATSKNRREIDKALIHHNLNQTFEKVCCGHEHQEKPHPAMLHFLMTKFNVESHECLMIGDTITDIQFANNAGIQTIGVTFGAHSADKLQTLSPLTLINEWNELSEVIDKLCYPKRSYARL